MPGWSTGRPIYHRLPIDSEQYQGNLAVDAITTPFDKILINYKAALDSFEINYINPDTAKSSALDWLAQLVGFTGKFWDTSWTDSQKRLLIKYSHIFIWSNKGTFRLLEWLLNSVFTIGATIYQVGDFLADFSLADDELGGDQLEYYILMPLIYETNSKTWKLAERINLLYMPVFCDSQVIYDEFYADLSGADDPLFS